jgi:hypothetical protein
MNRSTLLSMLVPISLTLAACGGDEFQLQLQLDRALRGQQQRTLPAAAFVHVIEGGGQWLVLHRKPPADWARGEPEILDYELPVSAVKHVDEHALPPALQAWRGRAVHLLSWSGPRCIAEVGQLRLIGRAVPLDEPRGNGEERSAEQTLTAARELWDLTRPVLAARLTSLSGDCKGATWARDAERPTPLVSPARAAPRAEIAEAALAALQAVPAYRAVARRFQASEFVQTAGPWEHHEGEEPVVIQLEDRATQSTLVAVSMASGGFCEPWYGQLTAVWRVTGSASDDVGLELLGATEELLLPSATADLDGDGEPEIFFNGGVIHNSGAGITIRDEVPVPSYHCPC